VVGLGERTYPRTVRRMLIRRSTPHPATRKTPMGGTVSHFSLHAAFIRIPEGKVLGKRSATDGEEGKYTY